MLQLHRYQPHLRCRSRPSAQFHRSNVMCPYNKFHISGLFCDLLKPFKHVHLDILLPTLSLFPSCLPTNTCMHLSSSPYMLHALPISLFLIWSPELTFLRAVQSSKLEQYRAANLSSTEQQTWAVQTSKLEQYRAANSSCSHYKIQGCDTHFVDTGFNYQWQFLSVICFKDNCLTFTCK